MAGRALVIGATGKVGVEVVRRLCSLGEPVKAGTRNPEAYRVAEADAAQVVAFDYEKPDGWRAALEGVDRVFVTARFADGEADRVLIPFFDAVREAGVQRVVFMTAMGVDASEEIPLRKAERYLEGLGLSHTFLRPNWFNQNFNLGFLRESILKQGGIFLPVEEGAVSFIDARDIAAVAVSALLRDGHGGKAYTLTGPEALSHGEVAAILSGVTGKQIRFQSVSENDARGAMSEAGWGAAQIEHMMMLFAAIRQGFAETVTKDVEDVLGREPIEFQDFAEEFASAWK